MKRLLGVALLVALTASPLARADFVTGNRLHQWCSNQTDDNFGLCSGYVMGIADALARGAVIQGERACFPGSATVGQARDIVKRHLESYPELRHAVAAQIVAYALSEAFPCRNR